MSGESYSEGFHGGISEWISAAINRGKFAGTLEENPDFFYTTSEWNFWGISEEIF